MGFTEKKCYSRAFHLVNKLHDFNGMHDLSGNFCYGDFFLKIHARLYRIDLYIGPASVDWTSLTASKETGLEDVMLGVEVWLENMNESQYK